MFTSSEGSAALSLGWAKSKGWPYGPPTRSSVTPVFRFLTHTPQLPGFRGVGVDSDLAVRGSIAIGVEDQAVLDHAARGVKC